MRRWMKQQLGWAALFLSFACVAFAQGEAAVDESYSAEAEASEAEVTAEEEEIQLPQKTVGLMIRDKSFFTDRVATAVVYFDTVVSQPDYWSRESDSCSVIEIDVVETPDAEKHKSAATLRFLPKQAGIVTLPVLDFKSETFEYLTEPQQVIVGEPTRSSAMALTLTPAKQKVYVGEPVRFDLVWDCSLNAGALKALRLNPAFFQNSEIEVIIPRNTDPEKVQVGLPIGGRRVIAKRTKSENDVKSLGRISLPVYLRFSEPGVITLPETRLECAQMDNAQSDFGRYAAHFNNSLFEAAETTQNFKRIYTTAAPIEIEVLPLPPEQGATFSGLFQPLQIDVSVRPTEVEIGELMELEVKLSGDAPHGMLELPKLSQQPGLRERFLVDDNCGRLWHRTGTTFRTRLRALSTSVQAFPALQLQVFDPEAGIYVMRSTKAIPLQVKSSNGQEFISLKSFEGAAVTLSNQPEGIWHNMEANPMNDLLNSLYSFIRVGFWPLLILGPVAFVALLPVVRERRRRALDTRYRLRAEAYAAFKKLSGNSPEKWQAFLRFMAVTFDAGDKAWTRGDSEHALTTLGAGQDDIDEVVEMHLAADAQDFSESGPQAKFKNLDSLAKQIAQLASKCALLFLLIALLLPTAAKADEWSEAEQLFTQAQTAGAGSEAAHALYQDAALKFQAAATAELRPGESWYNAGNAWFQAGAVGRAIVSYRQAELFRPFDAQVADNLRAARAMTLNDVPSAKVWWQQVPGTWLKVTVVLLNFVFWALLLFTLRYRSRRLVIASAVCGLTLAIVSAYLIQKQVSAEQAGAVVVDAVLGKKGPGYAFANAFNEPLHDGLEFVLVEQRSGWGLIKLPDTRLCWLPLGQMQLIEE